MLHTRLLGLVVCGAGLQIQLEVDMVLYSGGRDANSEKIGCENVGVKIAKYGRIQVS